MTTLNKALLNERAAELKQRSGVGQKQLPEKVLQFGTGVLLRGLPDYFIDKANKQGEFNGQIVVVKSTDRGGTDEFADQDNLYTLYIKGIENGNEVERETIISSISRVLQASQQWEEIVEVALSEDLEIIISNTTEVGIVLDADDDLNGVPPSSFPGKLTALLYKRFLHYRGDRFKGLVVLPTELINDNGTKLLETVLELSKINNLGEDFIHWIETANYFCNTLVDRIVPGKLSKHEMSAAAKEKGYEDNLAIMAEPFRLWAIESASDIVKQRLSFAKVDPGVVVVPSIKKFKELKLRLLNGSHTFSCGLAMLSGFETVKEAMQNQVFATYLKGLLETEIVPTVAGEEITTEEAREFADRVVDRFSNPFLEHQWKSISVNYTSKMQMRNLALIEGFISKKQEVPEHMALGVAAYLQAMKNGEIDDQYSPYFYELWQSKPVDEVVGTAFKNSEIWKKDVTVLEGFTEKVVYFLNLIEQEGALQILEQLNAKTALEEEK